MITNEEEEIFRLRISTILLGKMIKGRKGERRQRTTERGQQTRDGTRKEKKTRYEWLSCSSITTSDMNE